MKDSSTTRLAKSWSQRLRIDGHEFNVGLGSYPAVTLAEARNRALENVRLIEQGGDPRVKATAAPTFADALEGAISVLRSGWANEKTEKNLRAVMTEHVLPRIGRRPVDAIQPADVLAFLPAIALENRP